MNETMSPSFLKRLVIFLLFALSSSQCFAQVAPSTLRPDSPSDGRSTEDVAPQGIDGNVGKGNEGKERSQKSVGVHTMGFRISIDFLQRLVARPMRVESPVNTSFEGASVRGNSVLTLNNKILFDEMRFGEPFTIQLTGLLETQTSAFKGPAIVNNRGVSRIEGTYQLRYDRKQFSYTPVSVKVWTISELKSVCSSSRFLGALVREFARRKALQAQPRAISTTSAIVKQRIDHEVNLALEKVIARLNSSSRLDKTLQLIFAGLSELKFDLCTTDTFIQVLATDSQKFDLQPPGTKMLDDAALEIWLFSPTQTMLTQKIETLWESAKPDIELLLADFEDAEMRLRDLVQLRAVGDWLVFEIAGHPRKNQN